MVRNYIKLAFRNLIKNKVFTAINILGLSLGLATCFLIFLYVFDELSYDRYNVNAARIYRINEDIKFGNNLSSDALGSAPLAGILKSEYPEVEDVVRFRLTSSHYFRRNYENIREDRVIYADPSLFKIFTLPLIEGDANTALSEPHSLVINESSAKKYFNRSDHILGKTLIIDDSVIYKVTGIMIDIPRVSHFNFDFIISMSSLAESKETTWLKNNFNTYVLLRKSASAQRIEPKFSALIQKYIGPQLEGLIHKNVGDFKKAGNDIKLSLMPLLSIHLQSNRTGELGINGNSEYVYIFSVIGLFILLIACVNFMNLSTARSSNRAREVGVRKVLGSNRAQLVVQFLTESFIVTIVAVLLAIVTAWALLPVFNRLSDKDFAITPRTLVELAPYSFLIIFFVGLMAGCYPAFFLSGFKPVAVLKGKLANGLKGGSLRGFLVVFQFSISIFLIIGTLVIYEQLKYIRNKDLGYNRNQVLILKNVALLGQGAEIFKEEVKNISGVNGATLTSFLPAANNRNDNNLFEDATQNQSKSILTQFWSVDEDYIGTMGMKLISGRNFSDKILTDSAGLIVNQTVAKLMGVSNPVGSNLYSQVDSKNGKYLYKYHIIGVVKDFNFSSLRDNISPLVLTLSKDFGSLSIRIPAQNISIALTRIQEKWKTFNPRQELNYSFMDQDFTYVYRSEQLLGSLFICFSSLGIAIACLGLFGLAAYATEQRNREIGIRKVLGAGIFNIITLISVDFLKLIIIAIIIASPLSWFIMSKWLDGFAYRVNIQSWVIIAADLIAILISLVTVSLQALKAALLYPVKSLRSE
jgi:putative ABC transport system permease protein